MLHVQFPMKTMVAEFVGNSEVITAFVVLNRGIDQNNLRLKIDPPDDVRVLIREVELITQMKLGDAFDGYG